VSLVLISNGIMFIYCKWVSIRWQWLVNFFKNGKETAQKEIQSTQNTQNTKTIKKHRIHKIESKVKVSRDRPRWPKGFPGLS